MEGKLENRLDDGCEARILVVVDRPLQLFSALCVVMTKFENRMKDVDIAIEPSFLGSKDVVDRLRASGLVSNVFLGAGSEGRPKSIGKMMLRTALRPKKFREEMLGWFGEEFPELVSRQYCTLICGSINAATVSVKQCCCSSANVIVVDEGAGSHDGTVFRLLSCLDDVFGGFRGGGKGYILKKACKWLISKISHNRFTIGITDIYLFSLGERERGLYRNCNLAKIVIPENLSLLQELFVSQEDRSLFSSSKIFYLPTSGSAPEEVKEREIELIKLCAHYLPGLTIKNHPSRPPKDFSKLDVRVIDASSNWEMALLMGWIDEDSVLLGIASSAQFNPKLVAGIEPRCVFLYKLIKCEKLNLSSLGDSVEDLTKRYCDKKRVEIPADEETLTILMSNLSRGK